MKSQNMIPVDVLREAQSIVRSQLFVPLSPAEFSTDGGVCLCSAAILAKAGLQAFEGEDEAKNFETALAQTKCQDLLFAAFESLGWPVTLCTDMIKENDATDSSRRKQVISSRLQVLESTPLF